MSPWRRCMRRCRTVNDVNLGTQVNRVTVAAESKGRAKPEDVERLYVRSDRGAMVPIGSLGTISRELGPRTIYTRDKYVTVGLTILPAPGVASGTVMNEVRELLDSQLPEGYGYNWAALSFQEARNAGADVVVVYAHWGTEYDLYPDDTQLYYAERIAAAGADVIIGGHPHTVQPAQWLETMRDDGTKGRTLVLYSLGNFLADKRNEQCDAGIIFEFTIQKAERGYEIVSPKYIPTYICRGGNGKYFYKIVAAGQWLEERPDGMSPGIQNKVIGAWERILDHMGTDVAVPIEG